MLMFELHQRKKIPEKKSNGINKLMYVLHQRTDLPEKEKKTAYGPERPLIICVPINRYRVDTLS